MSEATIGVGVAGLGRSGWGIHCLLLEKMPERYAVRAVHDARAERRREAEERLHCAAHERYEGLLGEEGVELVVVATPSSLHAEFAIRALEAGKHVIVEKPMAATLAEADAMIAAARRAGRILTVYQNRRFEADYLKLREVCASGVLGRIVEIKCNVHHFGRRWDWQTLKKYGGGSLRNNGAHTIDRILDLLGEVEPEVWGYMDRTLTLGDAEDHVKLILKVPGGPLVDMEMSQTCAYPEAQWLIMGTQGTLVQRGRELKWRTYDPADLPERCVSEEPTPDRSYNREDIPWTEQTWTRPDDAPPGGRVLYERLYETVRRGAPLAVTPEQVRRQIAIIEECSRQSGLY